MVGPGSTVQDSAGCYPRAREVWITGASALVERPTPSELEPQRLAVMREDAECQANPPFSRKWLEAKGFKGFMRISTIRKIGLSAIPEASAVYALLRDTSSPPEFLERSPAGHFKGRDPTLPVAELRQAWVQDASTVYIGQSNNLRRRVKQRLDFGSGEPVGAFGGRMIWQLADAEALTLAWKLCAPRKQPKGR